MLYYEGLEQLIFRRHELIDSDELIIVSGYVGPKPIRKLEGLPIRSKVLYGMYPVDGIQQKLHDELINFQQSNSKVDIYYSSLPVHSKCYVWLKNGEVRHALLGSANFSVNGLSTPYREILSETTTDTFEPLGKYIKEIFAQSYSCLDNLVNTKSTNRAERQNPDINPEICDMILFDPRTGEVQNAAGLNWGQNPNSHTTPNDAYLPIRADHIRNYPNLFPIKDDTWKSNLGNRKEKGRRSRHNESIEIIWDDGVVMEGLLEGNYTIENKIYPKQISSHPNKSEMGVYLRERLNVPLGQPVRRYHLENYGRLHISVSRIGEGIYYFDFSK